MENDSSQYLAFGNESQAHYRVPANGREAYVMLAQPRQLTAEMHEAFEQVLADMQPKLLEALSARPEYDDQKHIEPQMRVFMPGTYGNPGDPKQPTKTRPEFRALFSYGSYRTEVTVDAPASAEGMRTTVRQLLSALGVQFDAEEIVLDEPEVRVSA